MTDILFPYHKGEAFGGCGLVAGGTVSDTDFHRSFLDFTRRGFPNLANNSRGQDIKYLSRTHTHARTHTAISKAALQTLGNFSRPSSVFRTEQALPSNTAPAF